MRQIIRNNRRINNNSSLEDIVLIPCWKRPEFLMLMLGKITNAYESDKNRYIFLIDRGFDRNILKVINSFTLSKEIIMNRPHRFHGNSCNLLEGYKHAARIASNSSIIYMIEEDIFISKDFFTFSKKIWSKIDPFAVSLVESPIKVEGNENSIFLAQRYQSLGVSFKLKSLEYIIPHARVEYYGNMQKYLETHFDSSPFFHEQDGLIGRIMDKNSLLCAYACSPRAAHVGFYGYNRPGQSPGGNFMEKAQKISTMTPEEMNNLASEFKDIVLCKDDHINGEIEIVDYKK